MNSLTPTIEEMLGSMDVAGRIWPVPQHWDAVWKMLPERTMDGSGHWQPKLPLILSGWWHSSDAEKRNRFESHLRWGDAHGALTDIANYLNALQPAAWHTES